MSESANCGFTRRLAGGLGNVVGGTAGQRFNRDFCAAMREGAAHDDGDMAVARAHLAQCAKAIHDRHFDVEKDEVGMEQFGGTKAGGSVGCGASYFKTGGGTEDRAQK